MLQLLKAIPYDSPETMNCRASTENQNTGREWTEMTQRRDSRARAEELLGRLSLEEKLHQLTAQMVFGA